MKVLILAAGYGTRLYPLVKDTPKALLEVNNKSLINYILDKVRDLDGLDEVFVVTNDKFSDLLNGWAKKQDFSQPIRIINDGTKSNDDRLGSIGDIAFVLNSTKLDDDLLVVGSDNLFDYSLGEYLKFAMDNEGSVTIGLYDIESLNDAKKFGVVAVNKKRKITLFEEKPEKPKSTLIGMCLYYLPKKTLSLVAAYLKDSKKSDTAGDYIRWLHEKYDVYGFKFSGKWYDIGSIESYNEAQEEFSS